MFLLLVFLGDTLREYSMKFVTETTSSTHSSFKLYKDKSEGFILRQRPFHQRNMFLEQDFPFSSPFKTFDSIFY